jgi:hypothetical protein
VRPGSEDPAEAKEVLSTLMSDHVFMGQYLGGSLEAKAWVMKLHALAYPEVAGDGNL